MTTATDKTPKQIHVTPVLDHVVIKRDRVEQVTPGGVHLPVSEKDKSSRGCVVAVGPGPRNRNGACTGMSVIVGEYVQFSEYAGTEVEYNGETYVVVQEYEILFVE